MTLTDWMVAGPAESRHTLRYLLLALATLVLATSCGNDDVGAVSPVNRSLAAETPAAPTQTSAVSVPRTTVRTTPSPVASAASDEPAGAVFPRHDEAIPANRGDQYVYGELSIAGGCLRISYVDQVDREATRDGLLVVWPVGCGTRTSDGVVEMTGPDGLVVAAAGQTLRLSGKKVSDRLASADEWDWGGGEVGQCGGPFWLVGDEVTAIRAGATGSVMEDDIFLPRLYDQRGPIISPLAGLKGRLTLRGGCLLVETPDSPGEYLVVWPPGFNIQREGDDILVLNGGGNVIAQVGDHVTLGGRNGKKGADYPARLYA